MLPLPWARCALIHPHSSLLAQSYVQHCAIFSKRDTPRLVAIFDSQCNGLAHCGLAHVIVTVRYYYTTSLLHYVIVTLRYGYITLYCGERRREEKENEEADVTEVLTENKNPT